MSISLQPVDGNQFIGPPIKGEGKSSRVKFSHYLNETSSIRDLVFRNPNDSDPDDPERAPAPYKKEPVPIIVKTKEEIPTTIELIDRYRGEIFDHVHQRVACFFQQLIVCYCTHLRFDQRKALDQAESATTLNAKLGKKQIEVCERNAAHRATLPCLIAYNDDNPEGFVYLKESDYYRLSNATDELPYHVNDADSAMDGTPKSNRLRTKSLALLNQASQGKIAPEKGLKTFIQLAIAEVKQAKQRSKKEGIKLVLDCYLEDLSQINIDIETDDTIFDQMLNVRVDTVDTVAESRKIIYQIRYRAIRDAQLAQTQLMNQFQSIKKEVLKLVKNKNKAPRHFEAAFRAAFIQLARAKEDRSRLLKLFNFPNDGPGLRPLKCEATSFQNTLTKIQEHSEKIERVVRSICADMRHLRVQEANLRGSITRKLRKLRSWRQIDLSKEIKKQYPDLPSSPSSISRIENPQGPNGKIVNASLAEQLARVFGVDPGLFMPSFFYA